MFHTIVNFYSEECLASCSSPKLEDHPLMAVHDCIFSICWKPFLHPQPEDPPCYGDRDTLITGYMYFINKSMLFLIIAVRL